MSICDGYRGQGLGISDDEFSPVLIASLKHLWTNLKPQIPGADGYSLSICCEWDDKEKKLSISLALAMIDYLLKVIILISLRLVKYLQLLICLLLQGSHPVKTE
jgi:hypothetical protein